MNVQRFYFTHFTQRIDAAASERWCWRVNHKVMTDTSKWRESRSTGVIALRSNLVFAGGRSVASGNALDRLPFGPIWFPRSLDVRLQGVVELLNF